MRTLNYPTKYALRNVNLVITDAQPNSLHETWTVSGPLTDKIERFIATNPDFFNLLPLNQPLRQRNVDIQLTWTAFYKLTALVLNFKDISLIDEDGGQWIGDFESWIDEKYGKELYYDKPWVIWETSKKWSSDIGDYFDYDFSPWPSGDYVESFNPCYSCGLSIGENTDNATSCFMCSGSIHGDGECGPWLDTNDYETAMCVSCYEEAEGERYGGYNIFRLGNSFQETVDNPNKGITYAEIRKVLTFIEETFNTFEWE